MDNKRLLVYITSNLAFSLFYWSVFGYTMQFYARTMPDIAFELNGLPVHHVDILGGIALGISISLLYTAAEAVRKNGTNR